MQMQMRIGLLAVSTILWREHYEAGIAAAQPAARRHPRSTRVPWWMIFLIAWEHQLVVPILKILAPRR